MADLIQLRRDTKANWDAVSGSVILADGEVGIICDQSPLQCKVGDGVSYWYQLETQAFVEPGNIDQLSGSIAELSGSVGNFNSVNVGSQPSLLSATTAVPSGLRKPGLILSYYNTEELEWVLKRYVGTTISGWNDENYWEDVSSGGGSGESGNYNELINKPSINGTILAGNKTSDQLGIPTIEQVNILEDKINNLPTGMYYGQYPDVSSLPDAGTLENKGYAYVASTDPAVYYIYLFEGTGPHWKNSGNKFVTTKLETNLATKSQTEAPTTKAVYEGIETVNLLDAKSTPLTVTQKYNASANINDRGADVVPVTGAVNALGYKVLNPNLTFAEQVENVVKNDVVVIDNSNIIFEIRDEFDLESGSVNIPANCTLNFIGGCLKNGIVTFNNTIIRTNNENIFKDLTLSGAIANDYALVDWYASDSGDDTKRVEELQKICGSIHFSAKTYKMNATITKQVSLYGVREKTILNSYSHTAGSSILYFNKDIGNETWVENLYFKNSNPLDRDNVIGVKLGARASRINFVGCGFLALNIGIYKPQGQISACYFKNNFSSCNYGLYFIGAANMHCGDDLILNNNFTVIKKYCIVIIGGAATGGKWVISNNDLQSSVGGILLKNITQTITPGVIIENNWFEALGSDNQISFDDYSTNSTKNVPAIMLYADNSYRIVVNGARVSSISAKNSQLVLENFSEYTTKGDNENYKSEISIEQEDSCVLCKDFISSGTSNIGHITLENVLTLGNYLTFRKNLKPVIEDSSNLLFDVSCLTKYDIKKATSTSSSRYYPTIVEDGFIANKCCYYDLSGGNFDLLRLEDVGTDYKYFVIKFNLKFLELTELDDFIDKIFYVVNNRNVIHKVELTKNEWVSYVLFVDVTKRASGTPIYPLRIHIPCLNKFNIKFKLSGLQVFGFNNTNDALNEINNNRYCIPSSVYPKIGNSSERPTGGDSGILSTSNIGYEYFDTTLKKPIYASAINNTTGNVVWTDAVGEPIELQVSDTSVLIGAATGSSNTVSVYYGGTTAPTITVLNSDDTANSWLTAALTNNTLTLTAAANTTSAPRGAKVLVTLGDELVIINVVQSY